MLRSMSKPLSKQTEAIVKPLLRGYLHAVAAVFALIGTILLLLLTTGDTPKQLSLLIYGLSSLLLFGWSAFYHIGTWSVARRAFMRRIDHANIFVLIAGTYTPIVFNVMTGSWRIAILTIIWVLAVVGVTTAAPAVRLPRWITAALYVVMGWVVIAALPELVAQVGVRGMSLLLLAGILYTLGAVAYALRKPTLWERIFGFHEVFHLATILANGAFFTFMLLYVVPFVRR
ncbi:MAG: hemolysin III family protein [Ktedonobacteraceae bacterium]